MQVFCENICVCQKKAVLLQAFLDKKHNKSLFINPDSPLVKWKVPQILV